MRCVRFDEPGRSSDTRLFFEMEQPEDTACSQVGRKIGCKIRKRQCGEPSQAYLRILVVDFSLADASAPDWFCWPDISRRFEETVRILTERAGHPMPFDIVTPARLSFECCFGEAVILDHERVEQARRLMAVAGLDQICPPPVVEPPPPDQIEALRLSNQGHLTDWIRVNVVAG